MKTLAFLSAAVLLTVSTTASAQNDTAHHRAVYNEINANEAALKKVTATYKDEPTVFALTGWLDYALFPLLFFCLAVAAQALWLRAGRPGPTPKRWATAIAALLSVLIIWIEFRFALRITLGAFAVVGIYAFFLNRMKSKGATQ